MIRKEKKNDTLADAISNILNVAPLPVDPEDDENLIAQVTEEGAVNDEDDDILLSKFRKQNIDFLEDVDVKYAGKKGSRNDLNDDDWETDEEVEGSHDDLESDEYVSDDFNEKDEAEDSFETEEESLNNSKNEDVDDAENFNALNDDGFKQMHESDANVEVQKGICVRNQLNIWENLLEIRIQLQKCLVTANKMPQNDVFKEMKMQSNNKFNLEVNQTKKSVENILSKLLELQLLLLNQYPETKKLLKTHTNVSNESKCDAEIDSDTNEEEEIEEKREIPCKRRKLSDYENEIKENHTMYSAYRNSVIQKWNDKTQIAVVKNNNAVHSVLNQIDHILNDRQRLIKRTQVKRSSYEIIGKKLKYSDERNTERNEENDAEIFDDDDFYHQLLRELIETKSSDVTDPVKLSRQWIQLQNMRSKMKRNIDTRATKGRKIRYTVHTKLINFMAPIDNNSYTEEARTELYNSLFGKNQHINNCISK